MRQIFFIAILFLATIHLQAQESTKEATQGWPIVERCVGEPIDPPEDWTFEGTILLSDENGVKALSGISQHLNLVGEKPENSIFIDTPAVSPDSQWVALPLHEITGSGANRIIHVYMIRIQNLINGTIINIEWDKSFYGNVIEDSTAQIRWYDKEHIIYSRNGEGTILLNPFTESYESTVSRDFSFPLNNTSLLSPDWTRGIIAYGNITPEWLLIDLRLAAEHELSYIGSSIQPNIISWSPNSDFFMFEKVTRTREEIYSTILNLYTREGKQLYTIYDDTGLLGISNAWSRNGESFAFAAKDIDGVIGNNTLLIAQLENTQVINTCMKSGDKGFVWSQNNRNLAFLSESSGDREILVLDTELWQVYRVGHWVEPIRNSRIKLIGWRED